LTSGSAIHVLIRVASRPFFLQTFLRLLAADLSRVDRAVRLSAWGVSMRREKEYEDALVEIVSHIKGLHTVLSSVMLDTAALRQSMLVNNKSQAAYADRVKAGRQIGKPLLESALRSYDQIIMKLREGQPASMEETVLPDEDPRTLH
jgi:hypothetical protein